MSAIILSLVLILGICFFTFRPSLDAQGSDVSATQAQLTTDIPAYHGSPYIEINGNQPSGWQVANYHDLIDGNYLYNRCHLIAFSLAGENANEKNLLPGRQGYGRGRHGPADLYTDFPG